LDRPALKNTRTVVATISATKFLAITTISGAVFVVTALRTVEPDPIHLQLMVLLAIASAAGLVWVSLYMIRRHNPPQYTIIALEGTLEITPVERHRRYVYERFQRIEATRDDLRLIEFREHWTGAGSKLPEAECRKPVGGMLFNGQLPEEDGRVHRWIYPGRPIGRGEQLDVLVRQVHTDDIQPQRPYFRQGGGRYRTGRVVVTVRFPLSDDPVEVEGAIWNTGRAFLQNQTVGTLQHDRVEDQSAGTVSYRIEVTSTAPHHSYGIRWTWRNGNDQAIHADEGAPPRNNGLANRAQALVRLPSRRP
jgi:hypothetical protein